MTGMEAHPIHWERSKDGLWQSQFMDSVGDGTGTINSAVDGSITPVDFCVTAPANTHYFITRMIGIVQIDGKFEAGGFGLGPALSNGMEIWRLGNPADPNDFDYEWTYQHCICQNVHFAAYCYDSHLIDWSNLYQTMVWRYTITKDAGQGSFWMKPGQSLCMRINDDLTTRCTVQHIRVAFIVVPDAYVHN